MEPRMCRTCFFVVVVVAGANAVKPEVQGNVAHGNFVACFSSKHSRQKSTLAVPKFLK